MAVDVFTLKTASKSYTRTLPDGIKGVTRKRFRFAIESVAMHRSAIQNTFRASLLAISMATQTPAQSPSIDPTLVGQIATIPAIDNHAHPLLSPPAYSTDRNFDALPVDNMEP